METKTFTHWSDGTNSKDAKHSKVGSDPPYNLPLPVDDINFYKDYIRPFVASVGKHDGLIKSVRVKKDTSGRLCDSIYSFFFLQNCPFKTIYIFFSFQQKGTFTYACRRICC